MASALPDGDAHTNQTQSQNDDATTFASSLIDQVNREDIPSMVYIQRDMLGRFEKTNEMLINFNILSTGRFEATVKDFQRHTQLLFDMKKDLDSIFKRIRHIKTRLDKTYPEAFAACNNVYNVASDDEGDDYDDDETEEMQHRVLTGGKERLSTAITPNTQGAWLEQTNSNMPLSHDTLVDDVSKGENSSSQLMTQRSKTYAPSGKVTESTTLAHENSSETSKNTLLPPKS